MSSRASGNAHSHAEAHDAIGNASFRIAAVSIGVTACLLAIKLTLGLISGSIAVLSDAVDSATDLTAGFAALVSVRISRWPADEGHPYGHGKIEAVSASVAATIVGLGGGFITFQAIRRLIQGSPDIDVGVGLIAMVVAAIANIVVGFFMQREARRSNSMALTAEATHLRTNVVQAAAIIVGLILVWVTNEAIFDPLTALLLAAYMAWMAVALVRAALGEIMDAALPGDDIEVLLGVLEEHEREIRGYHGIRTRRTGATRQVDMHVLFDRDRTVEDVHRIADQIADEIRRRLPGTFAVIHTEPDVPTEGGPGETAGGETGR